MPSIQRTLRIALLAGVAAIPLSLRAQEREQRTAQLDGIVREQGGGPLGAVRVTYSPGNLSSQTDASGHFSLRVPAGAPGTLRLRRASFDSVRLAIPALGADVVRTVGVTLPGRVQLDVVSVVADRERPLLNTLDAATGGTVERQEIERLPTDARDPIALAYNIGNAEVGDDCRVAGEEDVLRLDVPVHHAALVRIGQGARDVAKHADRLAHGKRAIALEPRAEREPVHEGHRIVWKPVHLARREKWDDVRLLETGCELDLPRETLG